MKAKKKTKQEHVIAEKSIYTGNYVSKQIRWYDSTKEERERKSVLSK